jgi:hypothetical protein
MPLPIFSFFSNADDLETSLDFQPGNPLINEDIIYAFEKYKAIMSFKVSANKNKGPVGCSMLLRDTF